MKADDFVKRILGIQESILDTPQKEKSPDVFSEDGKVRKELKEQIYAILRNWKKQINFKFDIEEIMLKGSLLGFQYTDESDLDVSVYTSMTEQQVEKIKDITPSGNKVKINGEDSLHNIDFYFLPKDHKTLVKNMDNIYDLANDKWEKQTESYTMQIPYSYGLQVSSFFMNGADLAVSQFFRDKREFEIYKNLDPETQDVSEEEKKTAISRKIMDLRADVDQIRMISHLISAFRQEGYEGEPFEISLNIKGKDKENPHQSLNEVVSKILERHGYRQRLKELADEGEKFLKENEE